LGELGKGERTEEKQKPSRAEIRDKDLRDVPVL
jgi:hypothetical protein